LIHGYTTTYEGFLLGSNDTTGHKNHNIEYSHHAGIIEIEKLFYSGNILLR
jgi:hypothetical protein